MNTNEELKNMGFNAEQINSLNFIEIHKCFKCGKIGIGRSGLNTIELVNMSYDENKEEYCCKYC
jgi:hypothetical protein